MFFLSEKSFSPSLFSISFNFIISDFVTENKIGFSIQNLKEMDSILKNLSYDDYIEMKGNVLSIRENIITGSYLKNIVLEIEGE